MHNNFTLWLKPLVLGLVLTAAGPAVAYVARASLRYVALAGLAVAGVGVVMLQRATAREQG